ncbi:MAG: sigma-70 family RNA polymerase sigma factor [Pirellulaceae bacterium]
MTAETTTELVHAAAMGDRDAFEKLVHRYAAMVTGVAYSVCGDISLSEDIAQEAFIEAWRKLATIQEPEKFPGWICTVARRRAIDTVRTTKSAREARSLSSLPFEIHDHKQPTPEASMSDAQQRELVWSMLAQLPEAYREPMVLFYRCEESTRDVAIAMGESEATIRQRLKRGREMIRAEVSESIRMTLRETAPKTAFATIVMASLPAKTFAAGTTASATAVATGKAGGGSVSITSALCGAVLGPMIGVAGGVFGTWMSWKNCEYERQQKFIVRQSVHFLAGMTVFVSLLAVLVVARMHRIIETNAMFGGLLAGLLVVSQLVNFVWVWRTVRGFKQTGEQAKADGEPARESIQRQLANIRSQTQVTLPDGSVTYEPFRWNAAAWFGSGLGATAWMLPLAIGAFGYASTSFGILVFACFLAAFIMVVVLWRLQERLPAYAAYQISIVWIGLLTGGVLTGFQLLANSAVREFARWTPWGWLVLIIFPTLSLQFRWQRKAFQRSMREA